MHIRYLGSLYAVVFLCLTALADAQGVSGSVETGEIPNRPEELDFGGLNFTVPNGEDFRHELVQGAVAYVAEDHTLPLVNIRITLKQGSFLDPPGKIGLSSLTGTMIRRGGTRSQSAEAFDERVEFLAANINTGAGGTQASARLNSITQVVDESLALFFEMLREPGFDEGRFKIERDNLVEAMKQRNDDADDILNREWSWLTSGEDHYSGRRITEADLNAITREDLIAFHQSHWRPDRMIFAISGDVDTSSVVDQINGYLADWPGSGAALSWPPPLPEHQPQPGLYHVEKDIPQGKVRIGHTTPQWSDWTNPDRATIQVMDHILGASGFTSRIMQRVRSDEGLAYSAGARFGFNPWGPGSYTVFFQSKSSTVALAAKIALGEVRRMQEELVTPEELSLAKSSLRDTFPRRFESAGQKAGIFASDAHLDRSHDYWKRWQEQINAVTADDVARVAKAYLKPDEMIFLVVGKWDEIEPGDAEDRASMKEFFGGDVKHIPLRDPLTLEPNPKQ